MGLPELSVVVCAFNEERSIGACVRSLFEELSLNAEVIVVDGGFDATGDEVKRLMPLYPGLRYVRNHNDRGKGHAIRVGIEAATAEIIVFFDADLQFFAADISGVVEPLRRGKADVVAGSRFLPSSGVDVNAGFLRNFGNHFFSLYASVLFGHRFTDVLAGTKAMTRRAAEVIDLQSDSYAYEVEILAKGKRCGLRVVDAPISTQERGDGSSKVSIFKVGFDILLAMTRFRFERVK